MTTERTEPKPRYFCHDYSDYAEWDRARPLPEPERPPWVPREWAGHICIAISLCLGRSEDGVDLQTMHRIALKLAEMHPGLEDEVICDGRHPLAYLMKAKP